MKRFATAGLPSLLLALALAGCSSLETSINRPEDQPSTIELRVDVPESGSSGSATVVPGPSANVIVTDGGTTLNISKVELVLDQVEYRRGGECVDSDDASQDDGDDCSEVFVQPTYVDLPLEGDAVTTGPVLADPGTYEGLEFDVHETTGQDASVLQQNPTLQGASVQVRGSFDDGSGGVAFEPTSFSPTGPVQLALDVPIDLPDGGTSSMTLSVDVASWFLVDGGLVNPEVAAADTALARQVRENVMASFSLRTGS